MFLTTLIGLAACIAVIVAAIRVVPDETQNWQILLLLVLGFIPIIGILAAAFYLLVLVEDTSFTERTGIDLSKYFERPVRWLVRTVADEKKNDE